MGTDAQFRHKYRPQGHHDHEVENMRKLHPREGQQQHALSAHVVGLDGDRRIHACDESVVIKGAGFHANNRRAAYKPSRLSLPIVCMRRAMASAAHASLVQTGGGKTHQIAEQGIINLRFKR